MCGILAAYRDDAPFAFGEQEFTGALDRIAHRGPDSCGFYRSTDRRLWLGHQRLHVTGDASASQPIANEDGRILATVNGEFYGFREIRDDLIRQGHRFRTDGDNEIVVHLYERYGEKFVEHLRGEFALVLYDQRRHRLIATRDRFGIKPLVYQETDGQLLVASEAKALFGLGVEQRMDEKAIRAVATMQYLPATLTHFAGVSALAPGTMLIRERGAQKLLNYWQLDYPVQDAKQPFHFDDEFIPRIRNLLVSSVADRLDTDVKVGFHLSGGLDSSCLVAIAKRIWDRPVHAFGLQFGDPNYDEIQDAQATAQSLGIDFQAVQMTPAMILDHLDEAVKASEGVAINGHLVAKYVLHQEMKASGVKVVISGEGADEVFSGYDHFCLDMASASGDLTWRAELQRKAGTSAGMMMPDDPCANTKVKQTISFDHVDVVMPAFLKAKFEMAKRFQSLLNPQWWRGPISMQEYLEPWTQQQLVNRHPVDQSSWLWTRLALAGYILRTLGDGTEMPHSLEGRTPYLDHRLHESVRGISPTLRIRNRTPKYLLREVAAEFLPRETAKRVKRPLDAPPILLMDDKQSYQQLQDRVRSQSFSNQEYLSVASIKKLLERLPGLSARQRQRWDPPLMLALSLESLTRMEAR